MSKKFLRPLLVLFLMLVLSGCSINFKNNKNIPALENNETTTTPEIQNNATTSATTTKENIFDLTLDSDKDGLTDLQELAYQTDSLKSDSDQDGFSDSDEIKSGYNPVGTGKKPLITEDCSSLSGSSRDLCYYNLGVEKIDNSICQKIVDQRTHASCIVMITLKKGDSQPCEAIKTDYPDIFEECQIAVAEYLYGNSIQVKNSRDVRTISDVKQIQTALEMYYNEIGQYPEKVIEGSPIASASNTYIAKSPQGVKGITATCVNNYQYKYTLVSPQDYTLTYCVERDVLSNIAMGVNIASPSGISKFNRQINSNELINNTELNGSTKFDRDAKVIAEIKQIQTALELYYNDANKYPETITAGAALAYNTSVYLKTIPIEIPGTSQACLNAKEYKYTHLTSEKYTLTYCLDGVGETGKSFGAGLKTASQDGINIK